LLAENKFRVRSADDGRMGWCFDWHRS
jgi:hypothetical protein